MIAVVVVTFLACWLLNSLVAVPACVPRIADAYVLRFALPVLIVSKMSRVGFDSSVAVPVAAAWCSMAACALAVVVLTRMNNWSRSTMGALLLVAVLGNTSFLGLGVVSGLLGESHMQAAIAYDQPGTFLALALWGSFIAGRYGSGELGWRPIVRRLLRFAPFVALLVSIPLRNVDLGADTYRVLDAIGRTVPPMAMGAVGLRFVLRAPRRVLGPAVTGLVVKMIAAPAALFVVAATAASVHDTGWAASIMQSAAPPMVTAGVVAVDAGLDEDLVTFTVGVGTLLAFVTLPVLSLLL